MDKGGEKRCSKCKEEKPRAEFSNRASSKDGLRPDCKPCQAESYRKYRVENPEKVRETSRRAAANWRAANLEKAKKSSKKYYHDNRERERERFGKYRAENLERLREAGRRYCANNREKRRQNSRNYRRANPEKGKEYRLANPQKSRDWARKHRALNYEKVMERQRKWQAENREKARGANAKWRAANPEKLRASERKRRALKRAAPGTHTANDVAGQFMAQKGKCWWCGAKLKKSGKGKYHVDHVIALARGGSNGPENIVCSCPACNLKKSVKSPLEFVGRLF